MISPELASAVLASSDNGNLLWLLAAGPAGAGATYWAVYRYYRNTDKSHAFERDTIIAAQPVQGGERKIDHVSRTQRSEVDGDNSDKHRQRVDRVR